MIISRSARWDAARAATLSEARGPFSNGPMVGHPRTVQVIQDHLDVAKHHYLSRKIFKLSNIAGPVICNQVLHLLGAHRRPLPFQQRGLLVHKMFGQGRYVFGALTQRRQDVSKPRSAGSTVPGGSVPPQPHIRDFWEWRKLCGDTPLSDQHSARREEGKAGRAEIPRLILAHYRSKSSHRLPRTVNLWTFGASGL